MADNGAHVFDKNGAERVVRAVRRVEAEPRELQRPGQPELSGANVQFLRVVSATLVGPGNVIWYTARVENFLPIKGQWSEATGLDVWLVQQMNYGLRPDQSVTGRQIGSSAGTVVSYPVPILDDQGIPLFDEAGQPLIDDVEFILGEPRPIFATTDKIVLMDVECSGGQIVKTKG